MHIHVHVQNYSTECYTLHFSHMITHVHIRTWLEAYTCTCIMYVIYILYAQHTAITHYDNVLSATLSKVTE